MSTPASSPVSPSCNCAATYAFLVLRLWLGLRALLTGLDKFAGKVTEQKPLLDEFGQPDINGAMVAVEHKVYALKYYQGLPAALGSKFAAEPLLPAFLMKPYVSLSFGLILINESAGVAWLGIHILLVVAALMLAQYNRFGLMRRW
jgi:thiosulfate dehydrogenase (quinone) large subunit